MWSKFTINERCTRAKFSGNWLSNALILLLLYVFIGSFIYFEQKQLLAPFSRAERTQILASIDWFVNVLTFVMAFFVSGRLVKKAGLGLSLALVPLLLMAGLLILAFAPSVMVILLIQIVRREGNYSLTRPAREMLFIQVTVDERFKAKPVIDVAVYRGGDAVSGMLFAGLTDGLGLGLFAVSLVGASIASLWALCGFLLGRGYTNVPQALPNEHDLNAFKTVRTIG